MNVVFHIPGEVVKPEFEGVRTWRFSPKLRMLMVQVAIPEMPIPEDVEEYLLTRVDEALDEAEAFARRRKVIDGRLDSIRAIVEMLRG